MKDLEESGSHRHGDVISKMFFSASIATMFTVLVGTVAQFIDGIITSRFWEMKLNGADDALRQNLEGVSGEAVQ